jgi:predicted MFS family arabinose efflux permease
MADTIHHREIRYGDRETRYRGSRSVATRPAQELRRWQDWFCMVLGILMAASPWLVGYTGLEDATLNAVMVGFLVFALSALALTLLDHWEAYLNAMLGAWLVLSPWLLRFEDYEMVKFTHLALGAFILVIAAQEIWQSRSVS